LTAFTLLVPGRLDQLTGGYLFDRQVVDGLRASGRRVRVVELSGTHPDADAATRAQATAALARLPAGEAVVIDGLALPACADSLARETTRLRVLGFVHHPLSLETGLAPAAADRFAKLESRLWPRLRGLLCPSEVTARSIVAAGVPADRVAVTPPGTAPVQAAPRADPAGPLRLLAVGTVTPRKGHRLLIEALAGLRTLDWMLTCIGSLDRDPTAVVELRAAIAAHQLADRVVLTGEVPHARLDAAYRDADLFVLPSSHEGYGMAFAEALSHRLPVIATTGGAIAHTVPADASLLVPPGDRDALRQALQRVLEDADLRARLAGGAARAALALSDWPTAVRRWANAFDRLAA